MHQATYIFTQLHFGPTNANYKNIPKDEKVVITQELDGVGPVDNRPSTNKLHRFVKKINDNNKNVTCDA